MPLLRSLSASRKRHHRYNPTPSNTSLTMLLTSCCIYILLLLSHPSSTHAGESTIPRSTNRYSDYNNRQSSSSAASISSSYTSSEYTPPWNSSPKIDSHGFLSQLYPRSPGEWEQLANIRGRYGPNSKQYPRNLMSIPVEIRQVPGDGNCLFHSIATCLYRTENNEGKHLPMDSHNNILQLRTKSLELRNAAVDMLQTRRKRRLFLQGEEYLLAEELLAAAAAQFELDGEEYCELMRKESYWGGGPEIVALCNYLQRPIHIYELVPTSSKSNNNNSNNGNNNYNDEEDTTTKQKSVKHAKKTCTQFTLRRMACFGSPKFDRKEPLHILSADSRFPDIEPKRIRRVGNHFLALFPVTNNNSQGVGNGGLNQFRNHALLRGGSRIVPSVPVIEDEKEEIIETKKSRKVTKSSKWDGGRGRWARSSNDEVKEQ